MIDTAGAVAIEALEPESRDAGVAAHYGDPMREQRTLATEVGLVDRSHRGVVAVPGPERASWLHSITTQHLADLRAGQGTELLVLSPHGHVEHHAQVAEDGTTTWLDTEPGAAGELLTFLDKMRFLTRVEPRDATAELVVLTLVGPRAGEVVPGLKEPEVRAVPGPKFTAGSVPATPTTVYDVRVLPEGGFARRGHIGIDLVVPRASVGDVIERLGVPLAGLWAYEAMRVAARVPRLGLETDHRTIPAEIDLLAPAVHLDKGCYRGQETVARVHNLGRPPRRLVLLHLDGVVTDQPPAPGTAVTNDEGRAVGFVGTALRHFELGMVALAVLKRNVPDDAVLRIGESVAAIDLE
ncbi:CAF17-like 4Fe-4S cluster assembly/insertion protein YgfZ [Phytohabitans houttuyneae]|uniref:Glycine cleavage system protein T n=1 Tax=Phytohabitans houttuyneae TaxID=1076126 RepID=A0A6V8K547_9ACTN|nr:folate-binding protein YgfZ [Phytohabitans houttuyneae]GFJ80323.1 glycine cleavage system protein T [Phytohabitans houttuyneae]